MKRSWTCVQILSPSAPLTEPLMSCAVPLAFCARPSATRSGSRWLRPVASLIAPAALLPAAFTLSVISPIGCLLRLLLPHKRAGRTESCLQYAGGTDGAALIRFRRPARPPFRDEFARSEEHTSELQSLMRISYALL